MPVVALLGEVEYDDAGLAHDKSSDMAAVLLTGADGRLALLAFTPPRALRPGIPTPARCPVTARTAALSALQEEAAAMVVDVAGPRRFVVEGDDLTAARSRLDPGSGRRPRRLAGRRWTRWILTTSR